jgi:hypothetical protein
MANFNDAEVTDIYVSQTVPGGIQDDAPNAPVNGTVPGTTFDATLEMVAGSSLLTEAYTVTVSCENVTQVISAPLLVPAFPQTAAGNIGNSPWAKAGTYCTYTATQTVTVPPGFGGGQVYQYTVSLISANGQVASITQSDLFVLY